MILKRRRTTGHVVLPVFYHVHPSHVRKQMGSFEEALTRHEERFHTEGAEKKDEWKGKIQEWRAALKKAANLAGMNLQNEVDRKVVMEKRESLMVNRGRDGGWIPVVRQWKGGGAQSKEAQHGLITVFVDNIPSTMDAKALYKLFIKFGIVKDTYIPFKRRKVTNSRFGFVRYNCSIAASVAIQKENGLLVDDSMLEVKLAAYDRNSRSEQRKKKLQPPRRFSDTINFKGKDALVGHRSFAEVLKGDTSAAEGNTNTNITIKAKEEGNGWLYESAIVRFNNEHSTHNILKVLEEKGMEQIEVRKGGGRDVIISFNSTSALQSNIGKIKEWFKDVSQSVMEWRPDYHLQQERCVWLRCYGIPLHLWSRDTLNSIGNIWGTILSIDGDVCHPKSFSYATIRVATVCIELINKTITLECKGHPHPILVCEDHLADSSRLKAFGMNDSSPTETCFSDEGRILPAAAAWVKNDGDEVAERRAVIGADLACTNEVVQRKVLPASHTAEEVGTVVEETPCKDGSSRDKAACVEGFSMEGSELNSKSNEGKIRCAQQAFSSDHISRYDFNNGIGPDIILDENLANEPLTSLGPSIGPGINLEVFLAHSPSGHEILPQPIDSDNFNPLSNGILAHVHSVSPLSKSRPTGLLPMNLIHSAKAKTPILNTKSLQPEKKKGKKKAHIEGFISFARFHGYRTAAAHKHSSKSVVFSPAVSAFAQSDLSEGSSSSNNDLFEEAKATIHLGKCLGINYNGKEDTVLSKIIDLELKDKDRISDKGQDQK
ncbi:hypothetical protein CsSME_00025104 [Camellia sinensis var. sinensis]